MGKKVKLEHQLLDSKIATAAALLNEWLKWCEKSGLEAPQTTHIMEAFKRSKSEEQNND